LSTKSKHYLYLYTTQSTCHLTYLVTYHLSVALPYCNPSCCPQTPTSYYTSLYLYWPYFISLAGFRKHSPNSEATFLPLVCPSEREHCLISLIQSLRRSVSRTPPPATPCITYYTYSLIPMLAYNHFQSLTRR
jgi:hypothetical protein